MAADDPSAPAPAAPQPDAAPPPADPATAEPATLHIPQLTATPSARSDDTVIKVPPTPTCLSDQSASRLRVPTPTCPSDQPAPPSRTPTLALPQVDLPIDADPDPAAPHLAPEPSALPTPPTTATMADAPQISRDPRPRPCEQTGETGIYTERIRRDAFELAVDLDDLPDLPAQESGWQYVTGRHPRSLRRFLLFRLLPASVLIAITAWSWQRIDSGRRTSPRPGSAQVDTTGDQPEQPAVEPPPADPIPPPSEPEADPATIAALKLLDSYAENVARDESVGKLQLHQAIVPRRITLLNLWAPWCGACLTELPFLKDVFEVQQWHDTVKFVPLMVNDPTTARKAFREHAADMPKFDHFLIDRDLSSGPKAALVAAKKLPEKLLLPVTILFDCRRRIHKVYTEAFDSVEKFQVLIKDVETLREKLDTPACRPPPTPKPETTASEIPPLLTPAVNPPTPASSPAKSAPAKSQQPQATQKEPPRCGDGRCDRDAGETCVCASDCPCSLGERCTHRPGEATVCLSRVSIDK
jgi:thiol-disulfide isomerase/thioredoxin